MSFTKKTLIDDINLMNKTKYDEKRLERGFFTRFLDSVEWLGNLLPRHSLCDSVCLGSGCQRHCRCSWRFRG